MTPFLAIVSVLLVVFLPCIALIAGWNLFRSVV